MIKFPVYRSFWIRDYQLFPGAEGKGLQHTFDGGVHIVAGINGLGKTTLLNALYRMLVGPRDRRKEEDGGLGSTPHRMVQWRNSDYFTARVGDEAAEAMMSAEIAFGKALLQIDRRLSDLEITSLKLNGEDQEPTTERYEGLVVALANVGAFFDFYALVKYVLFFLEDRAELIWDAKAQFDVFRILFFDPALALRAATLFDDVQRVNSEYRNKLPAHNKRIDRLKKLRAASDGVNSAGVRLSDLQIQLEAIDARDSDYATASLDLLERRRASRLKLEQAKLDLEEQRREHEVEQQRFFRRYFPEIDKVAEYVLVNLTSGGGCLVCGSTQKDISRRIRKALETGNCPVCDSPPPEQEKVISGGRVSQKRLQLLADTIEQLRKNVDAQQSAFEKLDMDYQELNALRRANHLEREEVESELQRLGASLPPTPGELLSLQSTLETETQELNNLQADQAAMEAEYRHLLDDQRTALASSAVDVRKRFKDIAGTLLAEQCDLDYTSETRSIGQSGEKFEFPRFQVLMTSGVFRKPTERRAATSVSESQKEYIDLAFRMALMTVASKKGSPAMLVLETPEASLDSFFVDRAGGLLRQFASVGGNNGNLLIATSNLNNENMIPALLGLSDSRQTKPKSKVTAKLINLLAEAEPNAALRANRPFYERQLSKALHPQVQRASAPRKSSRPRGVER